jgi:class 3 adenylate cyclase/YHS domain-containing protein
MTLTARGPQNRRQVSHLPDAKPPLSAFPPDAASATFMFADIAGYTALTEAHGDEQAADLVAQFFEAVSEELPSCGGTHVKTIGDALMLRIPDPAQAVPLGLRITHELLRGHGAPEVRVGLHHGPAIERDGDYFGATVNLAARVAAVAIGGEALLTAHTAALAPALDGILYQPRGRQTLRNIREPVELFAAIPQGQPVHGKLPIDPVCKMAVDPEHAVGRLISEETAYFFCTLACAAEFATHPERFSG